MTQTRYGDTTAQPRTPSAFTFRSQLCCHGAALYPRYMSITWVSQKKTIPGSQTEDTIGTPKTQALGSFKEHGGRWVNASHRVAPNPVLLIMPPTVPHKEWENLFWFTESSLLSWMLPPGQCLAHHGCSGRVSSKDKVDMITGLLSTRNGIWARQRI